MADGVAATRRRSWRPTRRAAATFLPHGTAAGDGRDLRESAPGQEPRAHRDERRATRSTRARLRRRLPPTCTRATACSTRAGPRRRTPPTGSSTISVNYRGYDVHEMPPSTQGFVALEMLNILEGFDIAAMGHNSADYLHARHRGQEDRLCRSRRLSRRPRVRAGGRARARCCRRTTPRRAASEIDMRADRHLSRRRARLAASPPAPDFAGPRPAATRST